MKIGIDASRAFIKKRTGIEEYSYQVIKNLRDKLTQSQVVLYLRENQEVDFDLPENWIIKKINMPRLWTQVGLSWELWKNPIDILFVPAHTVPIVHPQKTVVVMHGLEYEFCPQAYSFWERVYMRWSIKNSCRWSEKIIAVSQNTKKDLMNLYAVPEKKIKIIYEGYLDSHLNFSQENIDRKQDDKYLLFIGRIEERKNIIGIIKAFDILKQKYKISHKLILAGRPGYEYSKIKSEIEKSQFKNDILELGFVGEEEKWNLLKSADVFLFPTFYEGFGLPVLEAQSAGAPVVCSDTSSIPEVAGGASILVDPNDSNQIAKETYKIIIDQNLRNDLVQKGHENVKKFSWEKCAMEVADVLIEG